MRACMPPTFSSAFLAFIHGHMQQQLPPCAFLTLLGLKLFIIMAIIIIITIIFCFAMRRGDGGVQGNINFFLPCSLLGMQHNALVFLMMLLMMMIYDACMYFKWI